MDLMGPTFIFLIVSNELSLSGIYKFDINNKMSNKHDPYTMYKCETCGNKITGITKNQQSDPSSAIWARYGLCSAGCMAHTSILRKDKKIEQQIHTDNSNINIGTAQERRFDDQSSGERSKQRTILELKDKKILTWQRMISRGKILGGIGLTAGIILYYNEIVYGALACLVLVVVGIVLCRIGVWKKCRIR